MIESLPIETRLLNFISSLIDRERIDLIVCSERKATAIVRALIDEIAAPRLEWKWVNTLSSTAITTYDWSAFQGKKILLFDELVHHGNSLRMHEEDLCAIVPDGVQVITAGFAVWERCKYQPAYSYYRSVDSSTYEEIRQDIVAMLQENGSLLLDTEHIELSVRLQCGLQQFYDALARSAENGNTFSFVSGSGKTNLSIERPDILSPETLNQGFIPGSTTEGVVRKVRILEKTHDLFSILPIFYPNTRCVPSPEWAHALVDLGFPVNADGLLHTNRKYLFYITGLWGGIELLRSVVSSLHDLIQQQKIILEVPMENFRHLHAMFPQIVAGQLHTYVSKVVNSSKRLKAARTQQSVRADHVSEEDLLRVSGLVLYKLVERIDDPSEGVSWKQLMRIAEHEKGDIMFDEKALTVVADRLIDNGLMVTSTREVTSSSGEPFVIRTFAPDGEIVSSKIRQQIMVRTNNACQ